MLDRMQIGDVAKKHHVQLRGADGALRYEECFTRDGFDGPYTIMYHLRRPHTQRLAPDVARGWQPPRSPSERVLAKRHFKTGEVENKGGPPVDARVALHFNADITSGVAFPSVDDPVYVTNGDADELIYVHKGGGTLRSQLGDVTFTQGDYVFVPRGMIHRFAGLQGEQHWLWFELRGGLHIPKQWRNDVGQLRMDAPYCERDFKRPELRSPFDEGIRELVVKQGDKWHGFMIDDSPFDLVGWDGAVYPWAFPILAFQPRVSSIHLPPTWHGTFAARGALICSFVPRLVDFHPDAIPCPYPHSNVHCDEIIFYCDGNFTSRKGVGPGSISQHPMGIPHGPHPGAYERSIGTTRTDETAVMCDTFLPLHVTDAAVAIEDAAYHESFV